MKGKLKRKIDKIGKIPHPAPCSARFRRCAKYVTQLLTAAMSCIAGPRKSILTTELLTNKGKQGRIPAQIQRSPLWSTSLSRKVLAPAPRLVNAPSVSSPSAYSNHTAQPDHDHVTKLSIWCSAVDSSTPYVREVLWAQMFALLGAPPRQCRDPFSPLLQSWLRSPNTNKLATELLFLTFSLSRVSFHCCL